MDQRMPRPKYADTDAVVLRAQNPQPEVHRLHRFIGKRLFPVRIRYLLALGLMGLASCSPTEHLSSDSGDGLRLAESPESSLAVRIDQILESGLRRRLSAVDNAAWQILHGVICYGDQLEIETSDRGLTTAVDYAFSGGQINGFELMAGSEALPTTGRLGLKARLVPGSYVGQGHVDQWIAICAMANLPLQQQIRVGDQTFTIEDWARQAQYDVTRNILNEFSWTLIALTHYFPNEPQWKAADDLEVNWEVLVEEELTNEIDFSPCGGTHRMVGIARALQAKRRLDIPDSPVWEDANEKVDNLLTQVKEMRSPNGKLSSQYFTQPGRSADLTSELSSTGHLFEFVAIAGSDTELRENWVTLSAQHLCRLLESVEPYELDCGALYHALHGLKVYRERRFGPSPPEVAVADRTND